MAESTSRLLSNEMRKVEERERGSTITGSNRYINMDVEAAAHTTVIGSNLGLQATSSFNSLEGGRMTKAEMSGMHARLQRMANFESHNFDPTDNQLEEDVLRERTKKEIRVIEMWKWLLSAVIGLVMGVLAFSVDFGVYTLNSIKFGTVLNSINAQTTGTGALENSGVFALFSSPLVILLSFTVFLSLIAGGVVSYIEPLAAGSGIPELKTYLNGVHLKGLLRLQTLIAKLGGIMFTISAGFIAGKEGPFVHGGGLVGGGIGMMGSRALGFKLNGAFRELRTEVDKRDFVAIGTATGVAVAFGAPIGGMLFTVEEGASFYSTSVLWRCFLSTCIGVTTLHGFQQLRHDPGNILHARFGIHRDFGLYADDEANYGQNFWWFIWELPVFALMGVVMGLGGALFVKTNVKITMLRQKYIPVRQPKRRLAEVVVVGVVTCVIMYSLMYVSPCAPLPDALVDPTKGELASMEQFEAREPGVANVLKQVEKEARLGSLTEIIEEEVLEVEEEESQEEIAEKVEYDETTRRQVAENYFRQLYCPAGQYSVYGQLFFVPLADALKFLFHLGETFQDAQHPTFASGALALFWAIQFVLMTWTYGIGAPTGLFVPSLAVGAAFGQLAGNMMDVVVQGAGFARGVDHHTYAVIGAAACLGGTTRMTVSITVLVMETTGALELLVPLMLTIWSAKMVADMYGHGIYDTHIKIRGAPFLEEHDASSFPAADKLRVSEVMSSNVVSLQPVMVVREVVRILTECHHSAFPVSSRPQTSPLGSADLLGLIQRSQVLNMLHRRISLVPNRVGSNFTPEELLEKVAAELPEDTREKAAMLDTLRAIPLKEVQTIQDIELTEEELDSFIDLRLFMSSHPYIIPADARLSRAYRLFRTMGLRHMFVSPRNTQIVGVVTRKDLTEENACMTLGEKAVDMAISQPYGAMFEPLQMDHERSDPRKRG